MSSAYALMQKRTLQRASRSLLVGLFVFGMFFAPISGVFLYTRGGTHAAASSTLNFQARLLSSSGSVVTDGTYNVQFNLYDVSSGGTTLWTESYLNNASQGVTVKAGYLSVNLGSLTAFPSTINWDQELWLGMTVRGTGSCSFGACTPTDAEMTPRFKLTAVPYAFSAGQLQKTDSGFTSKLVVATPTANRTLTIPDVSGTICTSANNCTGLGAYIQNGTSAQNSANFNIQSTGTTNVTAKLRANTSQTADILQVRNSTDTTTLLRIAADGTLSVPGSGSGTERFGAGTATSSYTNALAVGNGATVTANNAIAIGQGTSTSGIAIGTGANGTGISIGNNVYANSSSVAINASANNNNVFVVGGVTSVYFGDSGVTGASPAAVSLQSTGSSSAAAAGSDFTVRAGGGSNSSNGSAGGNLVLAGGGGGAGNLGRAGGNVTLQGGNAAGTSGSAVGGNISLQAGAGINGGAAGTISIGTTTASTLTLGRTSFTTTNAGALTVAENLAVDTDTLFVNATTNRVGIGNASPTATLDVTGDAVLSGDLAVNGEDITSTGDLTVTVAGTIYLASPTNVTGRLTQYLQTTQTSDWGFEATTDVFDPLGTPVSYYGTNSSVTISSNANAEDLSATFASGVYGFGANFGTGITVGSIAGVTGRVGINGTGSTISYASSLLAMAPVVTAGTLTNNYGLYVENQTAGTNDYGIYVEGADTYALFVDSGITRLDGDLVVDTNTLYVDATGNGVIIGGTTPTFRGEELTVRTGSSNAGIVMTDGTVTVEQWIYAGTGSIGTYSTNDFLIYAANGAGQIGVNSAGFGYVGDTTGNYLAAGWGDLYVQGKLQVSDKTIFEGDVLDAAYEGLVNVYATSDSTTNDQRGLSAGNNISPASASTRAYAGSQGYISTTSTNLSGATLSGVLGQGINNGSGTIGLMSAVEGQVLNQSSGTISTATALFANTANNSGTITNNYGLYVADVFAGTNDYGVYIQDADTYALFVDAGATRLDGTLEVQGNTTLGDATSDTITFTGRVNTSINPSVNDTYDLGTDSLRWANIYLGGETIHIGTSLTDEAAISYVTSTDSLVVKNATNSTTAFQVQNSSAVPFLTVDTSTNNYLQVGSATTDATAVLFTLDSYNQATDPTTAANGALYYNTNTNTMRCRINGAWTGCLSGINGSGTSGQVSYWNGSNSQTGDANFVYSGGSLAIGTTSAATKLEVSGTGTNVGITVDAPTGWYAMQYFAENNVNKWHYEVAPTASGGYFSFVESGVAERMRISTGGNVGIGGTSANDELYLLKNQNANTTLKITNGNTGSSAYAELQVETDAGSGGIWMNSVAQTAYGGAGSVNFGTASNRGISLVANNTSRLLVSAAGTTTITGPVNTSITPGSWTQTLIVDNAATSTQAVTELRVAGTRRGSIRVDSSGNLVLSGSSTGRTYLSWDGGTSGVIFGNGSQTQVASVGSNGNAVFSTAGIGDVSGCGGYAGFMYNGLTANCTNYALIQYNNGTTYLNASSGTAVNVRVGNTDKLQVFPTYVQVADDLNVYGNDLYVYNSTAYTRIHHNGTNGYIDATGQLVLRPGSGTAVLTLDATGGTSLTVLASGATNHLCYTAFNVIQSCSSSQRYKHNIQTTDWGLDTLRLLRPVTFNWNADNREGLGFIAEEVAAINPIFATYKDGLVEGVNYDGMISVVASALQELDTNVLGLEQRLEVLETGQFSGNLTVSGHALISGDLKVQGTAEVQTITVNGKIITKGNRPVATVETIQATNDVAVAVNGTDVAGTTQLVTGINTPTDTKIKLTFAQSYSVVPSVVMSPIGRVSAQLQPYVESVSATEVVIGFIGVPSNANTYSFAYQIIQAEPTN